LHKEIFEHFKTINAALITRVSQASESLQDILRSSCAPLALRS